MRGIVKNYNCEKGWGWITHDAGDTFFHYTACVDGPVPVVGSSVTFEETTNPRNNKLCAANVRAVVPDTGLAWLRMEADDGAETA
jgi:cold shock CspA family protein